MSHRKEEKERLRQERLEREREAAGAAQRKKLVGYVVGGLLAVAAIAAVVVALAGGGGDDGGAGTPDNTAANTPTVEYAEDPPAIPEAREFDLETAAEAANCELLEPENEGSTHVSGQAVEYRANPPTSGNHDPVWTEDGAYTQAPRTENGVHSLEHGRINIQFKADLPQAQIDQLKALYDEDTYHMLLYPNGTQMRYQVAATTWDHALVCERFGNGVFDAIRAFKDQYRDQGPEFVP
jgi:hypothetical protein